MKKVLFTTIVITCVLSVSGSSALAGLIAKYSFDPSVVPLNELTGNSGSTWNPVTQSTNVPLVGVDNRSISPGDTGGTWSRAYLAYNEQNIYGDGTHSYSYTFWIKPTAEAIASSAGFLTIGDNNWGHRFGINTNGMLVMRLGDYCIETSTATLTAGEWTHVGVTFYDPNNDNLGTMWLYLDGGTTQKTEYWNYAGQWHGGGGDGHVGYINDSGVTGAGAPTMGTLIDDLRIYDVDISQADVQTDMATAVIPLPPKGTLIIIK